MTRRGAALSLAAAAFLLAGFAALFYRTAWLADDAWITLRTVDNWLAGYGPRWNVDERVQAYTHPLWFLLLTAAVAVSDETYLTTLVLSFTLVAALLALLGWRWGRAGEAWKPVAFLALLAASKAAVEYSSSGLEGPLAYLAAGLLALFLLRFDPARDGQDTDAVADAGRLALLASVLFLVRPDLVLLAVPALVGAAVAGRRAGGWGRRTAALLLGLLPALLWLAFATFYYGSPLPNTFFAKLSTGVPRWQLLAQGLRYLLDSLLRDPATPALLAVLALAVRRLPRPVRSLAAGVGLYLAYVVWVGGDFMSGRFLAPLYLVAAIVLLDRLAPRPGIAVATAALALSLLVPSTPLRDELPQRERAIGAWGISDERAAFSPDTGLAVRRRDGLPIVQPRDRGPLGGAGEPPATAIGRVPREVRVIGMAGAGPFAAGPTVHFVDLAGLTDPLLSRLPAYPPVVVGRHANPYGWRPGHFYRAPPAGYLQSLASGETRLVDPELRRRYDIVRTVTREPLWSDGRLAAIWRWNSESLFRK